MPFLGGYLSPVTGYAWGRVPQLSYVLTGGVGGGNPEQGHPQLGMGYSLGLVMPWAVCLMRCPAGRLSCSVFKFVLNTLKGEKCRLLPFYLLSDFIFWRYQSQEGLSPWLQYPSLLFVTHPSKMIVTNFPNFFRKGKYPWNRQNSSNYPFPYNNKWIRSQVTVVPMACVQYIRQFTAKKCSDE